jgi:hypothetical protein
VELNLDNGISNSFDSRLNSALGALTDSNDNNDGAACGSLGALINAIEGQTPNRIDAQSSEQLIDDVESVMETIPCP